MKMLTLKSVPASVKTLIQKKPLVVMAIAIVLIISSLVAFVVPADGSDKNTGESKSSEDHQRELIGAVDISTGAPQDGRDPANQSQNSLASAASKPEGPGQRTAKPAKNVEGSHSHHDAPAKQPSVNSAGCIVGYGKAGEQCLPTPGANKPVTCDYVHSKGFHNGISVTGDDPYHLDKNHDKTACGHGD